MLLQRDFLAPEMEVAPVATTQFLDWQIKHMRGCLFVITESVRIGMRHGHAGKPQSFRMKYWGMHRWSYRREYRIIHTMRRRAFIVADENLFRSMLAQMLRQKNGKKQTAQRLMNQPFIGRNPIVITALLLVDLQNDLFPGGALAVPRGYEILEPVNRLIRRFQAREDPIFLTRDWHPENHVSFRKRGGPWPPHCIAGTHGADFHPQLHVPEEGMVISKAATADHEAYSGFEGTNLREQLRHRDVSHVIVAGLATDYSVKNSVLDALRNDFSATVVGEAIRAVNIQTGDGQKALTEMIQAGAEIADLKDVLGPVMGHRYEVG